MDAPILVFKINLHFKYLYFSKNGLLLAGFNLKVVNGVLSVFSGIPVR